MRETGPARKGLEGTGAEHYLGFARTMLGQLKERMTLGELQQGKFTKTLPDGTGVTVESRYGQDTIRITVPPVAAPVSEQAEEVEPITEVPQPEVPQVPYDEAAWGSVFVCGTAEDETGDVRVPWVWRVGEAEATIIPCPFKARANAISADGGTVVGTIEESTGSNERAFRWTRADGFVDMGRPAGALTSEGGATSVSAGGRVIVGSQRGPLTHQNWVWTADTGMQWLEGSYSNNGSIAGVSPNGRFICGTRLGTWINWAAYLSPSLTYEWRSAEGFVDAGRVWENMGGSWVGHDLPQGTAIYIQRERFAPALADKEWSNTYYVVPTHVNDTGAVVGHAWCGVIVPLGGAVIEMYPPGDTPPPEWQPLSGLFNASEPSGKPSTTYGITSGGTRGVGNYRLGGAGNPDQAYIYTNGALDEYPDRVIYAMSPSGQHFAGAIGVDLDLQFRRPIPMVWMASGDRVVPLPAGLARGWCTGIAASTGRVSTDPQVSPTVDG